MDGGRSGGPGFWRCLQPILTVPARISTQFWLRFQVFGLEPLGNLGTSARNAMSNECQKWIQHPQNRGIPCFQPLGPTRTPPGGGPTVGACACWHGFRWHPDTRRPNFRGAPPGGRRVKKSWYQALTTSYPPILRVLNPFLGLI